MSLDTPQPAAPPPSAASAPVPRARRAGVGRWGLRLLALIVAVVSGLIVTFFSIDLGPRVKGLAERQGSKGLLRPLHIGQVRALVGRGEFEVTDVVIEGLKPTDTPFLVAEQDIDDVKSVLTTVRSKDLIEARVRTPGTIVSLKVAAGSEVKAGELVATVVDPKIALKLKALDAQIVGLESRVATARARRSVGDRWRGGG